MRPLLAATHAELESYLRELGQEWREDSSNRDLSFTRNRIRHELLPLLEGWNPRLREHMAQMAALARDEEAWWQADAGPVAAADPCCRGVRCAEVAAPPAVGPDSGVAIEASRLAALAPALQRRLIRYAAERFGAALDFSATESVRALALTGRAGQKLALPHGLLAERTARELRLSIGHGPPPKGERPEAQPHPTKSQFPARLTRPPSGFGSVSRFAARFRRVRERCASASPNGRSNPPSKHGNPAQLEARRPGHAAPLIRAPQGEGSAGTSAGYGYRPGALAGSRSRRANRLDARRGTGARPEAGDFRGIRGQRRCRAPRRSEPR